MSKARLLLRKFGMLAAIAVSTMSVAWCVQVGSAGAVDLFGDVCKGGGGGSAACTSTKDDIITRTIRKVTDVVMWVSGIAAVIMIMVGGFMYITAGGDASKVTEGKNTIIFSLVGIIVVVFSRFIILFVLSKV